MHTLAQNEHRHVQVNLRRRVRTSSLMSSADLPPARTPEKQLQTGMNERGNIVRSVPVRISTLSNRSLRMVERKVDTPAPLKKGERPTKRAIRLANALMLERKLVAMGVTTIREASERLGVSEGIILRVLRMLALTPEEMLRVINETY